MYPKYTSLGLESEKKNNVFYASGRDQSPGLHVRLFEHSINSPLGDCLYRFILTQETHTPSLGKYYRCLKKLLRLQCTPHTPPWALRAWKKHVFKACGRDQSPGLYIRLFERPIKSPLEDRLYRYIPTTTTHTPSLGKDFRCFKKLLPLQCTPNTPPWVLWA